MSDNLEPRKRDRKTVAQSAVSLAHRSTQFFSRVGQVIGGLVMAVTGVGALYVTARRLLASSGFGTGEVAFFALGALLLVGGFGIAINGPFWRGMGKLAGLADDVWDAVRGKRGE